MEKFERNIQEKLRDFQVQPPEEIWSAIENQLVQKQGKKFLWLKIAAAILLLVVSITSLVLYLPYGRIAEPLAEIYLLEDDLLSPWSETLVVESGSEILSATDEAEPVIGRTSELRLVEVRSTDSDYPADYSGISGLIVLNPIGYDNQLAFQYAQEEGFSISSIIFSEIPDAQKFDEVKSELMAFDIITPGSTQRGFALAAYLAPQQSFRYQRNTASFPYEALESQIFSFAAGLKFHYNINSRWEVESGIGYNLIGQAVNGVTAFSHPSMIPLYSSKGELISSHPQSMSTSMGGINFKDQSYYFADIASSRVFALKGSYDESNVNLLNKSASGLIQHFGYIEVPLVFRYKINFGFAGGGQRRPRGSDISIDIDLKFQEAVFGTTRSVRLTKNSSCTHCQGTGAKAGTDMVTCTTCSGAGRVHETRQSILGSFTTVRECNVCNGTGKVPKEKCPHCAGSGIVRTQEEIEIKVPAGIQNGEVIRMTGRGEAIPNGDPGDLYIKIHVVPHNTIRREGTTLHANLPVKLSDALLGADYSVETLDGPVTVSIPAGITHGEQLRIKQKGVPSGRERGDFMVHVKIETPKKLSRNARKLVEQLRDEGV